MKITKDNFFTFSVDVPETEEEKVKERERDVATAKAILRWAVNEKKKRCRSCLNSRTIVSENGCHPVCTLSVKKATMCLTEAKDMYVPIGAQIQEADNG